MRYQIQERIKDWVKYMPNTKNSLRQPVFKGYRNDVLPEEVWAD